MWSALGSIQANLLGELKVCGGLECSTDNEAVR